MKHLVSFLCALPGLLAAGSSIHLAVIDEEMAAVLPHLITQDRERPVLVVERGLHSLSDPLLEREFSYYDQGAPDLITRSQTSAALSQRLGTLLDRLCHEVADSLLDIPRGEATLIPCVPSKLGSKPELSVYVFNAEGSSEEATYLVRLPEMGLQPGLVGGSLAPILDAIVASELSCGNEVEFFLLGCGGGVDTAYGPGAVGDIAGSLYLGVDLFEGAEGSYFQPRILLRIDSIDERIEPDHILYAGDHYPLDKEALGNTAEQRKLYKLARQELSEAQRQLLSDPAELAELAQLIDGIRQSTEREVSLTTSFFCGADGKELGAELGIHSVNMEDYQVIGVINELRARYASCCKIPRFDLRRQVEDPALINAELNERFLNYLKGASYPPAEYPSMARSSYLDALCWALLHNRDYRLLPESANWAFAWQQLSLEPSLDDHFYAFESEAGTCILDPFFAEIASDMLADMCKGHFLTPYMIDVEVHRELRATPLTQQLLERELKVVNQRIARRARKVFESGRQLAATALTPAAETAYRDQLDGLLDEIAYIGGEKAPCIALEKLPEAYRLLLDDPLLRGHFVPTCLGPEDLQKQLGFCPVDSALLDSLPRYIGCLRNLELLDKTCLHTLDETTDGLLQEHLQGMNDRIQLRKLALDYRNVSLNDLYVLVKLVYQLVYPLPRVGFFVKHQSSLDEASFDVWTRPGKWFSNLTGFANHLPYDYLVSDHGFEAGSRHALLRALNQIMGQVELQDSILDRALYKSTLEPALLAVAKRHVARSRRSLAASR